MWFILGILFMVLMLAISIGLHELGHLYFAKKFKVRVPKFMIGFGPTLFSWRKGETEYGIKGIPLGGFISMIGMYPPNPTTADQDETSQQEGAESAAEPAGVVAPSRYDDGQRYQAELPVGPDAQQGYFKQLAWAARHEASKEIQPGDEDRVFYKLPVYKRLLIMFGGPLMNLVIAAVILAILVTTVGTSKPTTTVQSVSECVKTLDDESTECSANDPAAPAAEAGLQGGETIIRYDGQDVETWDELSDLITTTAGQETPIVYLRDGEEISTTITPMATERQLTNIFGSVRRNWDGSIKTGEVGFVGIASQLEHEQRPVTEAFTMIGQQIGAIASIIVVLPQMLYQTAVSTFSGEERDPNGPISVVGVGRIAGEISALEEVSLADRFSSLLSLTAGLNVALFVFNLIPLLPLDGGHIFGALWEGLRRRTAKLFGKKDPGPFDAAKMLPLTYIVFGAFMVMGLVLIVADIFNPVQLF